MTHGRAVARSLRDSLTILLACQAVAFTLWLLPASVQIVRWPADGPLRLGLLPSAWTLLLLCAGGTVTGGLAMRWGRRAAESAAPFLLLWLCVVPYLPWIPDRFPLLLVLAGPLRWVVAVVPLLFLAARTRVARSVTGAILAISRRTVFAASLSIYLGFGLYAVSATGLSGDEPHYLIITESLLKDGDLKIENNHQRGDYRAFSATTLRPDFWQRGKNGDIYSVHAPGLSVLVLPVYAVAGHMGAVALMCLISALAALAIWDLADRIAGRRAAVLTWAAVCLTVPFIPEAWSIFPETPGVLLVAWAMLWLSEPDERWLAAWIRRGAILATLPWFHTKFSILLAVAGLALAWRLRHRPMTVAAFLAPIGASTAAWLWSFYVIYGSFDPQAPYGNYTNEFVLTRNVPHGLLGLFTDQKFGLLFYSPIYLLAIAGARLIRRRQEFRLTGMAILTIVASFTVSTARLYMFWGGTSSPARFLVPILPCLAPLVALAIGSLSGHFWRAITGTALGVGLAIAAWSAAWPGDRLLFSDPHGLSQWLRTVQGNAPLAAMMPTFTEPDWTSQVASLLPWMLAALAGLAAAGLLARTKERSPFFISIAACLSFLITGSVAARTPSLQARDATARDGALDAIWRADAARLTPIDYGTLRVATTDRVQELSTVTLTPDRARVDVGGTVAGPLALPSGSYRANVWFSNDAFRSGDIRATAIPPAPFGHTLGPLPNPTAVPFDLPVTIWRWVLAVDRQNAGDVDRVEIVPAAVRPPGDREGVLVRSVEPLTSGEGRFLVYTDGNAYPERGVFWSHGTSRTRVLLAPAGASRAVLTVSSGPMSGSVEIGLDGAERSIAMVAGQEQDVVLVLPAGERLVPLTIRSTTSFRPSDVDPSSPDRRTLGCQVRVRLE